jgi:tetratricopeptide (TPR) repeat protein
MVTGGLRRCWRRVAASALGVVLAGLDGEARAHVDPAELVRETGAQVVRRPDDPEAHLQHARAHRLMGEWDAALAALEVAARHGADPDEVGAARGLVLLDAGRPRFAKREFDRVLARRPGAYGLLFERGRACLALGRTAYAARDFGRAIAGMPHPRPEHVIARRDALLALGRRLDALAALDDGMARLGRIPSLQLPAIDLEVDLGRWEPALRRLDALLAQTVNPAWVARRGDILVRAGRVTEARAEYARALALVKVRSAATRVPAMTDLERRLQTTLASTTPRREHE